MKFEFYTLESDLWHLHPIFIDKFLSFYLLYFKEFSDEHQKIHYS